MHDPSTLCFDIKIGKFPLVAIWHIDPETDGTDDSCGWFRPRTTEREDKIINDVVSWEKDFPYYSSPYLPLTTVDPNYDYSQMLAGDCLAHIAGAWQYIAWARDGRRKLTAGELWDVVNLSSNPDDNLRTVLADPDTTAEYKIKRFFYCVMRAYLRFHRPWWRHPRWHIHHWEFQVYFIQTLKRWLFSRCAHCEERFAWGYSPTSGFGGKGPRWFKSEEQCYHSDCYSQVAFKSEPYYSQGEKEHGK